MADLVLIRGKIITMDPSLPQATALAAKGDRIIAVGDDDEISELVDGHTRVLDLEGKLAVPGLIDGHGHYMSLGESLTGLPLQHTRTWAEIVDRVAVAARDAEPGEWISGRGWHQDKWAHRPNPHVDGLPTHHTLSNVSPENPVILIHASGHGVFVNAQALQDMGLTSETPDPPGGQIVRDARGQPTGMLRETAQGPARQALADHLAQRPSAVVEADLRYYVQLAAEEAMSKGITTFHDMGETFETIDLLKRMADEGNLPVRLYVCIQEPSAILQQKLAEYRMIGCGNDHLTVRAIGEKVLDGALGVHGGWLLEPYADKPDCTGFNVTPVEDIRHSAKLAIEHGFQMAIQGIGDRAVRELLDIYEATFAENPDARDLRWRIEHCQVIHPDDLERFTQLGVIASVRGVFATSDGPWVVNRLGERRARERGYRYQALIQSGAVLVNGTDPPVEDIDPISNFYCTVTRQMDDGRLFFPEQRLTRQQALASYTINNAYAAFEERTKGSLAPGKLADVIVLSKDILTIPDDEIPSVEVLHTIIGGAIRYQKTG
jgi:predicted amidohydrolase YtcJ